MMMMYDDDNDDDDDDGGDGDDGNSKNRGAKQANYVIQICIQNLFFRRLGGLPTPKAKN